MYPLKWNNASTFEILWHRLHVDGEIDITYIVVCVQSKLHHSMAIGCKYSYYCDIYVGQGNIRDDNNNPTVPSN